MSINCWPETEQPRERLVAHGPTGLSDADILAILIRTGRKGHSAVDISRELLAEFGGLRQILDLDKEAFCEVKGVGSVTFAQLQACLELGRRYLAQELNKESLCPDSAATQRYLRSKLRHQSREVFVCLFLDAQNQMLKYEELFFGTVDGATVYPREVVTKAIKYNASAVIFAHNHPSGCSEPSLADRRITQILVEALDLIDVRVLDHIVVGDSEVSFAERGLL